MPRTDTECRPSENPAGSFVTQPSTPWDDGGKVQAVFISVPVTPKTFCSPVTSPAAGLGAEMVPSSVWAGSGVTVPFSTMAPEPNASISATWAYVVVSPCTESMKNRR